MYICSRDFVMFRPEVIKLFACSTQLSMKSVLLINLKLLTIANSFRIEIFTGDTSNDIHSPC